MHKEFAVHRLNDNGMDKAQAVAEAFDACLTELEKYMVDPRCAAIVRTKLEEASFFAKKSMAMAPENQQQGGYDTNGG